LIREHNDRLPADLKGEVEGKIAAVRSALQSGTIDQIRSSTQELSEALSRLGTAVYQQAGNEPNEGQAPGAPGAEGGGPTDGGGTVEGEFREV
ncbi:MAG TPA: molecular chaperone DnaK, partial [Dehalococcoidia bacterium]|nr:molecular chaperone DnaK [Dehalococcoidia bacterium]